jgi:hypothetical protein
MIRREGSLILLVCTLTAAPLMAKSDLPNFLSGGGDAFCGLVEGSDLVGQSLLIRQDDGKVETVPFSRWTEFFKIVVDAKGRKRHQAIEPTDLATGDRLCIRLDPSGAVATSVLLCPGHAATSALHPAARLNLTKMEKPVGLPIVGRN